MLCCCSAVGAGGGVGVGCSQRRLASARATVERERRACPVRSRIGHATCCRRVICAALALFKQVLLRLLQPPGCVLSIPTEAPPLPFMCLCFDIAVADSCPTRGYLSSCQPADQCSTLAQFIESGRLSADAVLNCGYTTTGEKICCPRQEGNSTNLRFSASESRDNDTQATTPSWLNIFRTDREYLVTTPAPVSSSSIVFPDRVTGTGAACQTPLYQGKCEAVSDCQSLVPLLQQRRLRDEDVQTCRDGTIEEIICCPTNLPLHPIGQVGAETRLGTAADDDTAAIAKAVELLPHYTHLAALAYPNAAFDGHVHRCTALTLTPQVLLSAAGCGHASHAVFGVADMRDVDEDEDYLVDITVSSSSLFLSLSLSHCLFPLALAHVLFLCFGSAWIRIVRTWRCCAWPSQCHWISRRLRMPLWPPFAASSN